MRESGADREIERFLQSVSSVSLWAFSWEMEDIHPLKSLFHVGSRSF